jgi:hypothetical protein
VKGCAEAAVATSSCPARQRDEASGMNDLAVKVFDTAAYFSLSFLRCSRLTIRNSSLAACEIASVVSGASSIASSCV